MEWFGRLTYKAQNQVQDVIAQIDERCHLEHAPFWALVAPRCHFIGMLINMTNKAE
jgi:hypothetical protein